MGTDPQERGQSAPRPRLEWLATKGAAGALAALLLLRLEAIIPIAVLKSKLFPVAVLCCAEASWLFGGDVGLLLAAQWLVHELAHVQAAQSIGLHPGWRSLIPFIGVYSCARTAGYGSRENEALVAVAGVAASLTLATAMLAAGQFLGAEALTRAARLGFVLVLINLLPFRPFDGGRIFPGFLWRCQNDAAGSGADLASRRFIATCRAGLARLSSAAWRADARTVVAHATVAVILGAALFATLASIFLAPALVGLAIMASIGTIWCFIAAVIDLDPRELAADTLAPRRSERAAFARIALAWRTPLMPRAALAIYGAALAAAVIGASA